MRLLGAISAWMVLGIAFAAGAQTTTGTISGRALDVQGLVVPGVNVTVTGSQGSKSAVSDAQGRFSIPFLTPGTYTVHAELQGFKPFDRTNVVVPVSQTVTVPIEMQVGGLTETVEVTGQQAPIDVTSTTIGSTLSTADLARLPIGRRMSDTLYVAPGVSSSGTLGSANPSIHGSSGLENQYIIDGVNLTSGGYGALGSYSITFGSLGNGTPYDFMQEVQVKTGGYEAEYGQATGGVINVVTKSGSNEYAGSIFGYTRPKGLEANWRQIESANGTVNTQSNTLNDGGATFGGPVVRNRVFFFGAIDPQQTKDTYLAPNGFPLQSIGEAERVRNVLNYAAKGTWQVTPSQRIDASFFGDPANGPNGPQRSSALRNQTTASFSELTKYGGHNQTVRYEGVFWSRFMLEASLGRALNQIIETPFENSWFVRDRTVVPNVNSGGIGSYEAGNRSNNWQYSAKATNIFGGGGQHSVRYGFTFENLDYDQLNQRTGPTFTVYPNGPGQPGIQTATGAQIDILSDPTFGKIYRVTRANLNVARPTNQHYTAVFVEDEWKVGNSLTIRPGLRYEQETLSGTIVKDFTLKNNWAPRIGASWDPTRTGRAKVFGNYGRYFARMPNDLAARALSADQGISNADYFDANLTQPVAPGVLAAGSLQHYTLLGAGADVVDPDTKMSYYNEYILGANFDVMAGVNVGARYIHRDIGRVIEDVLQYPLVDFLVGVPETVNADYLLTNPSPSTPVLGPVPASFEDPIHNYNAIEFTLDKRLAHHWAMNASYRYSRLRGTYEGFYRDDNGQSDPGITSLYDFPTNDPSYTQIAGPQFGALGDIRYQGALGQGPLPLDRPHQAKLYGTYVFDMGLNFSVGADMTSGKPLTALAANPSYGNGGEIPMTVRGAGFQTSEGFKDRTPFTTLFNAQVGYTLKLGGTRNILLSADVFNLFNRDTFTDYNAFYETSFTALNPDFGVAGSSSIPNNTLQQVLAPRALRLGARFQF
jgi:hypothetical protein